MSCYATRTLGGARKNLTDYTIPELEKYITDLESSLAAARGRLEDAGYQILAIDDALARLA